MITKLLMKNETFRINLEKIEGSYKYRMYSPAMGVNLMCAIAAVITIFDALISFETLIEKLESGVGTTLVLLLTFFVWLAIIWATSKLSRRWEKAEVEITKEALIIDGQHINFKNNNNMLSITDLKNTDLGLFSRYRFEGDKRYMLVSYRDGITLIARLMIDTEGVLDTMREKEDTHERCFVI